MLAAYKPLGVEPGKVWDPAKAAKIDSAMFRQVAEEAKKTNLAYVSDLPRAAFFLPGLFQRKGKIDLDSLVFGIDGLTSKRAAAPVHSSND